MEYYNTFYSEVKENPSDSTDTEYLRRPDRGRDTYVIKLPEHMSNVFQTEACHGEQNESSLQRNLEMARITVARQEVLTCESRGPAVRITRPWFLLQPIKFKNHNVNFNLIKHQISVNIGITYQIHTHGKTQADSRVSLSCCFYQDCSVVFLTTIYLAGLL